MTVECRFDLQIFEIPSASGAIALPSPAAFAATGLHKQDSIQSTSELFDDIDQVSSQSIEN